MNKKEASIGIMALLREFTNLSLSDLTAIEKAIEGEGQLGIIVDCPICGGDGEQQDAGFTLTCWFCLGDGEVARNSYEAYQKDMEKATGEGE